MSLWIELLTALPVGAAEAVASSGVRSLGSTLRARGKDELADDVTRIAEGQAPQKPITEVAAELASIWQYDPGFQSQLAYVGKQKARDGGININAGGDVHLDYPSKPGR
jgi:hypothetical protein